MIHNLVIQGVKAQEEFSVIRVIAKYRPLGKPEKRNFWGSSFLPSIMKGGKSKKLSPGQMSLPWDKQKVTECTEVHEVAETFIQANGYQPPVPGIGFA